MYGSTYEKDQIIRDRDQYLFIDNVCFFGERPKV